jgi:hypothetical protein
MEIATSNDPWGPTGTEMQEIAQMTYNSQVPRAKERDSVLTEEQCERVLRYRGYD